LCVNNIAYATCRELFEKLDGNKRGTSDIFFSMMKNYSKTLLLMRVPGERE